MPVAYIYLLPCAGAEDLAKIGMTVDPLGRWSAFSARWFEAFDLERALLVEAADRRDARRREARLHRAFAPQRCPMPLHLRAQFGGASEWFRGAYDHARAQLQRWCATGEVGPVDPGPLLAARMAEQAQRLHELLEQAYADACAGMLAPTQRRALRDLLAAHRHFDPGIEATLPPHALLSLRD